jgi:hypothetical protein
LEIPATPETRVTQVIRVIGEALITVIRMSFTGFCEGKS